MHQLLAESGSLNVTPDIVIQKLPLSNTGQSPDQINSALGKVALSLR